MVASGTKVDRLGPGLVVEAPSLDEIVIHVGSDTRS